MTSDISQLIDQALAGEQKAYTDIVDRFRDQIYHFIYRMVKDKAQAEDLTQETFIKAFRALASFNSDYAFSTWLYKIAANNCIDYFRKKKLATSSLNMPVKVKDGELQRDFPVEECGPETELISKEQTSHIRIAIDALPEKYKQAIILRHSQDKSYEEIAEQLEIPLGTVKVRIFRAREMLKSRLKEQLRNR
ncbi:sigma-70 family RNA polymerase sigma factor [candidate division KSB1 bacterium]|nr:sigma-70 family RNA polymerase sigma factor [candidate division KSB1 bacterium]RQW09996.1 MAG: sigma-70 family RNA polymerase sigma factor [candidate division KSB1 bacterium]